MYVKHGGTFSVHVTCIKCDLHVMNVTFMLCAIEVCNYIMWLISLTEGGIVLVPVMLIITNCQLLLLIIVANYCNANYCIVMLIIVL